MKVAISRTSDLNTNKRKPPVEGCELRNYMETVGEGRSWRRLYWVREIATMEELHEFIDANGKCVIHKLELEESFAPKMEIEIYDDYHD